MTLSMVQVWTNKVSVKCLSVKSYLAKSHRTHSLHDIALFNSETNIWDQPFIFLLFWHKNYKNFVKLFSRKTSLATLCKLRTPPIRPFTLIKNSLLLIPFVLIKRLIKLILLCINTFACLKVNQYSTRLFISYSVKNPIAQNYFKHFMPVIYECS
jgi:hypothetical protein